MLGYVESCGFKHLKIGGYVHQEQQASCCNSHTSEQKRSDHSVLIKTSVYATIHCLTGCSIGEVLGLALGVTLGLSVWCIMMLGTALAFIIGFSLAVFPLMKAQSLTFLKAFKVLWIGEVISITVMEVVMNFVDYHVGGMQVQSLQNPQFYAGIILAIPAGFLAAWPVNYLLIKHEIKGKCH